MIIDYRPLSWWVQFIRSGTRLSVTKHSDASLYCMQGKEGGDCNGCDYSPELRAGLLASLRYRDEVKGFHVFSQGVQRLEDRDREGFDSLIRSMDIPEPFWLDTGILAASLMEGKLYPFIEAVRERNPVIVTNERVINDLNKIFSKGFTYIQVPESNAYNSREFVYRTVESFGDRLYLFSAGMASCAMIPVLHSRHPRSSFIDVGHIWDALLGNKLRHYLKDVSERTLQRNLEP